MKQQRRRNPGPIVRNTPPEYFKLPANYVAPGGVDKDRFLQALHGAANRAGGAGKLAMATGISRRNIYRWIKGLTPPYDKMAHFAELFESFDTEKPFSVNTAIDSMPDL